MQILIRLFFLGFLFQTSSLSFCAEKKSYDEEEFKAFLEAITEDDHLSIELALTDNDTFINRLSKRGKTPLQLAASNSDTETLKLLVSYGAEPQQLSGVSLKAIHYAAIHSKEENFTYLLAIGSFRDGNYTAPGLAKLPERFRALLKEHEEANKALLKAAKTGDIKAIQNSLEKADLEAKDSQGRTAFLLAVLHGHSECLMHLQEKNARIDAVDTYEMNAYHLAAFQDCAFAINILGKSAGVNGLTKTLNSPLGLMLRKKKFPDIMVVKALLRLKADPTQKNKQGETPLSLAKKYESIDKARSILLIKALQGES